MNDWIPAHLMIIGKVAYLGLAVLIIWALRRGMTGPKRVFRAGQAFRASLLLKGIHLAMVAGFAWMSWFLPSGQRVEILRLSTMLCDDGLTFGLLLIYFIFYMAEIYRLDQKFRGIQSSFGSYLIQYGFFQILLLDILLLFRLDDNYLPFFVQKYPKVNPNYFEAILIALFLGIQGIALLVRGLKMADAPAEVRQVVDEVARVFDLKIHRVKVWKLELVGNAFATGLIRHRIFLTESLLRHADLEHLRMIVGHECAHFKLRHLEIRMILIAVLVLIGSYLMDLYPELSWIYIAMYVILGFLIFFAIARVQELQADRLSAGKLGGGPLMAEALLQVFGMRGIPGGWGKILRWFIGHPEMAERVKRLERM